jgi:hypothetical protein
MSESPLIFVSHSSKDNDLTRQFCEALRAGRSGETCCDPVVDYEKLEDYENTVLVDVDELQAGKPWPKQLHEWMARCHAAVLLLTANAVKSPWVLKEATILSWRLSLDESFRFFIVRSNDVSDSDMTARGFDPLMLDGIQKLMVGPPAEIAAQVLNAIPPPTDTTPFDSLCGALQDLAQSVQPNTLKRMAEKMRVGAHQWQPDEDQRQQYVRAIAVKLLSEDLGGYEGVDDLVNDLLVTTQAEIVEKILHIVAPHWVDAVAAGRVPSLATCRPRLAIAMNGAALSDFTAEMYVRRAYPLSRREQVVSIPSANSGDIIEHIIRELYWRAQRERSPAGSEALKADQKADVIKHFDKDKLRYFVVLSEPHPSGAELKKLMNTFPKLTFILGTGDTLLDPEPEAVVCLKPEVILAEEEKQQQAYEAAIYIIRNERQR